MSLVRDIIVYELEKHVQLKMYYFVLLFVFCCIFTGISTVHVPTQSYTVREQNESGVNKVLIY